MLPRDAPSAERTPISRVRSATLPDEHAVDAGGREHQRRERERLEQDQREAPLGRRGGEQVVHRRDPHDRLILVDRPDRLANGGRERGRVAARADHQRHRVVREAPLARR